MLPSFPVFPRAMAHVVRGNRPWTVAIVVCVVFLGVAEIRQLGGNRISLAQPTPWLTSSWYEWSYPGVVDDSENEEATDIPQDEKGVDLLADAFVRLSGNASFSLGTSDSVLDASDSGNAIDDFPEPNRNRSTFTVTSVNLLDLGSDLQPLCVTMPRRVKLLVAALPPAVYDLTGKTAVTGRETLEEMIAAMWKYALTPSTGQEPYTETPLTRLVSLRAARACVLKPRRRGGGGRMPAVAEGDALVRTVRTASRRMVALSALTVNGTARTAAALLAALRERATSTVKSAGFTPPFRTPLRYRFSTQSWRDLERVIIQRAMESPYSSIVDMRKTSAKDLAEADAVIVPWPTSSMRGRAAMGPLMQMALKAYVPSLWKAPSKHVFVFARIMRDMERLKSLAKSLRPVIRSPPFSDSTWLSFEPHWSSAVPARQVTVPYVGAVRRENSFSRRPTSRSRQADQIGGVETSFVPPNRSALLRQSAVNGVRGMLPAWHPADPWFARRAVTGSDASAGDGMVGNRIRRQLADSQVSHDSDRFGRLLFAHVTAAFRRLAGSDPGTHEPDDFGAFLPDAAARATLECDPLLLDADGRREDGATCTPRQQMEAVHVERPLLISFIGAPRPIMERTATIRSLAECGNCGLFDVRSGSGSPLDDGLAMAWVYSHSVFCAHPHGDSPSRKAFFDSALYGCIPLALDSEDPGSRWRAPLLPFSWELPWRNMSALITRPQWQTRLLRAVKEQFDARRIRSMQLALASSAHLLQYSLPLTGIGEPPLAGPKPVWTRQEGSGWTAGSRRCAEDAFDVLTVALQGDMILDAAPGRRPHPSAALSRGL